MRVPGDIIRYESCDSTNTVARSLAEGRGNFLTVCSKEQTSGRGQDGHVWISNPGENLTFSILLDFSGSGGKYFLLTRDIILITCMTTLGIRDYLLDKGINARIKWPNDIWVGNEKICGILIENILEADKVVKSIVGIGLNVNQTDWPPELPNPVSIRQITGKSYDLEGELEALREKIHRRFLMLSDSDGRISLQEEFGKYMFRLP